MWLILAGLIGIALSVILLGIGLSRRSSDKI